MMAGPTSTPVDEVDDTVGSGTNRLLLAVFRVGIALLWIENSGWKSPPDFESLRKFTRFAVDYPVLPPFSWVIEHLVLPNFTVFAWLTLIVEASLGAFLLIGLATRLWALIGIAQSLAIAMSVMNAPHEWEWSYYLMILAHVALFATAAGRSYGLDGVLRPSWRRSDRWFSRPLMMVS